MYNKKVNSANVVPGRYVVAVSGGVDSVVLLDMLRRDSRLQLIVAHFDHGMREHSAADADFVRELAQQYGLPFETAQGNLGSAASEAFARQARYAFLRRVCAKHQATAIITAHHQDDLLETVLINLLRGTGWRGLASLRDTPDLRRPLLQTTKAQLVAYARANQLAWHEDHTNTDERYLRNHVRQQLVPRLDTSQRQELLALTARQAEIREQAEELVAQLVPRHEFSRVFLVTTPTKVAYELLRHASGQNLTRPMLARMLWFAKTAKPGKMLQVSRHLQLIIKATTVVVCKQ